MSERGVEDGEGEDDGARASPGLRKTRAGIHMGTGHIPLSFQRSGYLNTLITKEESTRSKFQENKYLYKSNGLSYLGESSKGSKYLIPFDPIANSGGRDGYFVTERCSRDSGPMDDNSKHALLAINDLKLRKEFLQRQLRMSSVSISKNFHLREMALNKVDDQVYGECMEDIKKLYNQYRHKPPPKFT